MTATSVRLALQRIPIALSMMSKNTRHYSGGGRKITQIVSPKQSGPINRLIGTVDIDGAGTEHSLEECNPFMLLDAGVIPKGGQPKFGAHPHRGHSVVTLLLQGKVESWDSFHDGKTIIEGPASYWVDAGSGLFHNEMTIVDNESDPLQHCKLMQLWISVKEEDRLKQPTTQHDTNLPVEEALNSEGDVIGSIRYFVGKGDSISTPHPITVAHVTQDSGTTLQFPINGEYGGFVVHLEGCATYGKGCETETKGTYAVHVLDDNKDESYLQITTLAGDSSPSSYLICVGEKIHEPWYKKLTSNGAVVARSKEEAREIASKVEEYSKEGLSSGNFAPFGKLK